MSQAAPRPWWADVQHLREPAEQRRRSHEPSRPVGPVAPTRARDAPREHGGRRTVVIRGQAIPTISAPRLIEVDRRRPPRRPIERSPARPDRLAGWAVGLGMVLVMLAAATGHG